MCPCNKPKPDTSYRVLLPADVQPETYRIHLTPDLERFTFQGSEEIDCVVRTSVDRFTIHARDLLISSEVSFQPEGQTAVEASEVVLNNKQMTVTFVFPEKLPTGKGTLSCSFSGCLNDQMAGFYRSGYTDIHGKKRFMATTQMEAVDCRRAFPCWDEPAIKAIFEISLTVPEELMALSNMPEAKQTLSLPPHAKGPMKTVKFLPTPKMSSYLVAMCVGQYEFVQGQTKSGTLVRVLSTPGKAEQCRFALNVGIRSLDFYEDFFQIPYPLPKMDMIAIPDFSAGAMENWGLVTYREIDLLCDEKTVSIARKTRLATVVTHELAHQWFGNLVTMAWWDDLWLNEGFANWMQTYCADHLFPEWKMWEQYVASDQQHGLALDSLRSSHPIQVPIPKGEDVDQVFDAISYCKGGSVVRMIFAILGEELFKKGLQLYMRRHAYSNTETEDLWKAFFEVSKVRVSDILGTWTGQMGFPLVVAELKGKELALCQKWFVADGSVLPEDEKKNWIVPIVLGGQGQLNKEPMFMKEKNFTVPSGGGWLKLNYGQHIPMRVCYSDELFKSLINTVKSRDPCLPPIDRIGLLSDSLALAKSGHGSTDTCLRLLGVLKEEENVNVWDAISTVVKALEGVFDSLGQKAKLDALVSKLIDKQFKKLGWISKEGEDADTKRLRSTVLRLATAHASVLIKEDVVKMFEAYKTDPKTSLLTDETRPQVFKAVLKLAESERECEEIFRLLKEHATKPDASQADRLNIYGSMGFARFDKIKNMALDFSLSEQIKTQDFMYPMMSVSASSVAAGEIAWKWLQANFDAVHQRVATANPSLLKSAVACCARGGYSKKRAEEVDKFFNDDLKRKEKVKPITREISQLLESTRNNASFLEKVKVCEAATNDAFWKSL